LLPPNLRLSNQNSGLLVSNVKSLPNYFHLLFKTEISDSKRVTGLVARPKALLFQFSRHDGGRFSSDLRWQFIWQCDQLRNPCIIGKSSGDEGVAKLADAQDLGFHVSRLSNLLTDIQHYTALIDGNFLPLSSLLVLAHIC
jgi:hypothetical protein